MNKFDIKTTNLDGTSMLEASAGTGKTYSVAIMVLRLILEKEIPLEKILMVTFTNAAVAELETRIRLFVRLGYKYACGEGISDKNISEIVGNITQEKKELLRKALHSLDNLSVMTIHGFCQKTIGEFTFETDQPFDYEIVTEDAVILKNASNLFVREVLNTLDYDQFKEIITDLKTGKMHEMLRKHLQGMKYVDSKLENYGNLDKVKQLIINKRMEFDDFIQSKFPEIINSQNKDPLAKEAAKGDISEFKRRFNDQIIKPAGYFQKYECLAKEFVKYNNEVIRAESELFNYFYLKFFQKSADHIKKTKQKKGYISYDDQIKTIHAALNNSEFINNLKQRYEAVFIDEFQDTDKYQYEIFSQIFEGKTMFYIGDPKQSIYGWRSADLDIYKTAKTKIGKQKTYTLGTNFRSTPRMLEALEQLMSGVDMFEDEEIRFESVSAGKNEIGELRVNGQKATPVTIWRFDVNDVETSYDVVTQEIFQLLQNGTISDKKVKPGDIGVLVRKNKEGLAIKQALVKLNIPAVQRDDTKVLESDEADQIRYLILAVLNPKRDDINRAIQSRHFGFPHHEINDLREDEHIEVFLKLKNVLREKGVYNMIAQFLDVYEIRKSCMKNMEGQRVLSNINQIAEILHRLERRAKLKPEDLVVWMERNREDSSEEYQQRIESDDDAVQIATIHKSKGLEYKIVFAPSLCLIPNYYFLKKNNINTFKKDKEYCFTFNYPGLNDEDKQAHDKEKLQEDRRLIYVALTRAAHKCYISYMPRSYNKEPRTSAFDPLFEKVQNGRNELIEVVDLSGGGFAKVEGSYMPEEQDYGAFSPRSTTLTSDQVKVPLQLHSFSALSRLHHSVPFEKAILDDGESYDHFIFQELGRGANVGTALHSIFEQLDFNNRETWAQTLRDCAKYYPNILKEEWMDHFQNLVKHTLDVDFSLNGDSFRLSNITRDKMLAELQFHFSMEQVNKQKINEILGDEAELVGDANLQGLMTGFVDLVFEHKGKYYILDWKSNHLGNNLDDYNATNLDAAMKGSNYNLQYMIYTLALKRWLKSRIPDFDYDRQFGGVIYLFLRGVRQGSNTGIFTTVPEMKTIEGLEKAFLNLTESIAIS